MPRDDPECCEDSYDYVDIGFLREKLVPSPLKRIGPGPQVR
jgi:hypothetical protein